MATIPIRGLGGDAKAKKPTPKEIEQANIFAKNFALRKGLISGENTHTGGVIPPFVDPAGRSLPPPQTVAPVGMLSNKVPAEIKNLEWDSKANLPYYIDPASGDAKYVDKSLFYSPRFRRSNAVENPLGNPIIKR
jgi:hypothetical protein